MGLHSFFSPSGAGPISAQMENATCLSWAKTWDQQITETEAPVFNDRGDSYCPRQVDKCLRPPGSQGEIKKGSAGLRLKPAKVPEMPIHLLTGGHPSKGQKLTKFISKPVPLPWSGSS